MSDEVFLLCSIFAADATWIRAKDTSEAEKSRIVEFYTSDTYHALKRMLDDFNAEDIESFILNFNKYVSLCHR